MSILPILALLVLTPPSQGGAMASVATRGPDEESSMGAGSRPAVERSGAVAGPVSYGFLPALVPSYPAENSTKPDMFTLALATYLGTTPPRSIHSGHAGEVSISVDSVHHTLTITAGPFDIEGSGEMPGMEMEHHAMHDNATELPLLYFKWPVEGWVRGFELHLIDNAGRTVDRRLLHHVNIVNFARRQLFYPAAERLLAVGQETPDISLPRTIGIPVQAGWPMALLLAWHNEGEQPVAGVRVQLVLDWSPSNLLPRPTSVLPVYMNVIDPVGRMASFDLPAGPSSFSADMVLPAAGRLLGIGGHGHDYTTGIALQRVDGTRVRDVVRLHTTLDPAGHLHGIDEVYPGIRGAGIRLRKGATYRILGTYNNPTGHPLKDGGMIHIIFLYAVDDMRQWPALDPQDPGYRADMDFMVARGSARADRAEYQEQTH